MPVRKTLHWIVGGTALTLTAAVALCLTLLATNPALLLGFSIWFFDEQELTELASAHSSDGRNVATLYSDTGGGAWSTTTYVLYLWQSGRNKDPDRPLLVARRLTNPRLVWNGQILTVSYSSAHLDWFRGSWRPPRCGKSDCTVEIRLKPNCSPCGSSNYGLQTEQIRPE